MKIWFALHYQLFPNFVTLNPYGLGLVTYKLMSRLFRPSGTYPINVYLWNQGQRWYSDTLKPVTPC